jgi:hypothetical protein
MDMAIVSQMITVSVLTTLGKVAFCVALLVLLAMLVNNTRRM